MGGIMKYNVELGSVAWFSQSEVNKRGYTDRQTGWRSQKTTSGK
jgi:hypothetical protein